MIVCLHVRRIEYCDDVLCDQGQINTAITRICDLLTTHPKLKKYFCIS